MTNYYIFILVECQQRWHTCVRYRVSCFREFFNKPFKIPKTNPYFVTDFRHIFRDIFSLLILKYNSYYHYYVIQNVTFCYILYCFIMWICFVTLLRFRFYTFYTSEFHYYVVQNVTFRYISYSFHFTWTCFVTLLRFSI